METALTTAKDGKFEPKEFFKDATLLGGIKLAEILPGTNNLAGAEAPKMVAREFPDRVEARFEWATDVTKPDKAKLLVPRADKSKPPTRLTMNGVDANAARSQDPASAEATATHHQLQGEPVRVHHPVVRGSRLRLEERTEARRHGAAA